jgi:hypothetical protein
VFSEKIANQFSNCAFVGDIESLPFEPLFAPARRALQSIPLFAPSIGDGYLATLLEESQAHCASQPTRATGYQGYFARELRSHDHLLCRDVSPLLSFPCEIDASVRSQILGMSLSPEDLLTPGGRYFAKRPAKIDD